MAFACAYAVLGDFHLAEDASQEAFITAWRKLDQLRQPEAVAGWLRKIVLTECNRLTRRKRLPAVSLDEDQQILAVFADPQTTLEGDELRGIVFTAIRELPEKERMAITLFYLNEYSQREIGEFLEVPLTAIAKRIYSAKTRLRGVLVDTFNSELRDHRPSRNMDFATKVKAGIYDEYVGQYEFDLRPELIVTVHREGDKLFSFAAGQKNELFAMGEQDSELRPKEFEGAGKFLRDAHGRISHVVYYEFGQEMGIARKIA